MKSVPRWLTSITDMPLPCQSSSSAWALRNTGSGNMAGPGLKLKTRFIESLPTLFGRSRVVAGHGFYARNTDEPIRLRFVETYQPHALSVAAHRRDIRDRRANHRARRGDQHDLVLGRGLQRADEPAVALRGLDADDALTAAALHGMLVDRRQLAVTVLRGRHDRPGTDDAERDDLVGRTGELQAAHAGGGAAHRAHVLLREPDRLARAREQHDVLIAGRDAGADEAIVVAQLDGDDAARALARERGERRLLDGAVLRREEHELVFLERLDRQHRRDALAFLERQQVHDRSAARAGRRLRHLVHL